MSDKVQQIAIIGASGYTGSELIRLLHAHPNVAIRSLIASSSAGQPVSDIYPHLYGFALPDVITLEQVKWDEIDIAFCCLPHATSQEVIAAIPETIKVIDLSADFRLNNLDEYATWYGHEHLVPVLQKQAIYGLSEINREHIKQARLVACPGCYPTSALLPLAPLVKANAIELEQIIIDAKSGISGAGRKASQANLFCELNEGVKAYNIGKHRHIPEIEQCLGEQASDEVMVHFTPQIVPMSRGILSTIYVQAKKDHDVPSLKELLQQAYAGEPFVHVVDDLPATREVVGSNRCLIGVVAGRLPGQVVIVSVIDNLIKGASGQAVQNMNLLCGYDEKTGLNDVPLFP